MKEIIAAHVKDARCQQKLQAKSSERDEKLHHLDRTKTMNFGYYCENLKQKIY